VDGNSTNPNLEETRKETRRRQEPRDAETPAQALGSDPEASVTIGRKYQKRAKSMVLVIGQATEQEIAQIIKAGWKLVSPLQPKLLAGIEDPAVYGIPEVEPGDEPRRLIMVDTDLAVVEIVARLTS
jgi:hypothetical protein